MGFGCGGWSESFEAYAGYCTVRLCGVDALTFGPGGLACWQAGNFDPKAVRTPGLNFWQRPE